ncbi:MAG: aspartate--tRNA ligase [Elusimicrobia bacterium]|nr:aspartate--tRNA ligase [Elusimicrobiota bacterium]
MLRTHYCGDLTKADIGKRVRLAGWVHAVRDHGGVLFIDLRDRRGFVQLVFKDPSAAQTAKELALEYVALAEGTVASRPPGTENTEIATGQIEVSVDRVEILNRSKPAPFPVASKDIEAGEETRLKYRFIDLRRPKMTKAMRVRHEFVLAAREFLSGEGFWEIETPILTKSTPEGARDFLVPSRMSPGEFYALPQSPQIFKQMLMVSGMDRYFQIARCFRDEDLRADRQPEFTQIDLEMSFVNREDVLGTIERLIVFSFEKAFGVKIPAPFERLTYQQTMADYCSDKPDLRFREHRRRNLNALFSGTAFKVFDSAIKEGRSILSLKIPGGATAPRHQLDKSVEEAKAIGAKGLVWIKFNGKAMESPVEKYFSVQEKEALLKEHQNGDLVFICAEEPNLANRVLGELQKRWAALLGHRPQAAQAFCWITDFPLLEYRHEDKRWQATHNPFTAPREEDVPLLDSNPSQALSQQYDLVMNGVELASGSIRNHRKEFQEKLFGLMGYGPQEAKDRFGWMLEALEYGAPPHGGIALGVDRIVAMMLGEDSIREVIAFPKTQRGTCPFSGAPTPVDSKQLKEVGLKLAH